MQTNKIKIPKYAINNATQGLKLRKSLKKGKKFGLSKSEASKLGLFSGVEMAKNIISGHISLNLANRINRNLPRFARNHKKYRSQKTFGTLLLWGDNGTGKFKKYILREIRKRV